MMPHGGTFSYTSSFFMCKRLGTANKQELENAYRFKRRPGQNSQRNQAVSQDCALIVP
jgi:hypothetical protein